MKPLHETVNPLLDGLIVILSPLICALCLLGATFCSAALFAVGNQGLRNHYHRDMVTPLIILIIVAIIAFWVPTFCEHCIFQKELGVFHGADYAEFYHFSSTCVLPHAEIRTDPDTNNYTLILRMRYQLDELVHAHNEMRRKHRVYYNFQRYNIPGTTCQVQMAISKHTVKYFIDQMRKDTSGKKRFLILETSVTGSTNCGLPPKLQFVSRWDLTMLRHLIASSPDHLATAAIDIGVTTRFDASFVDYCDTLLISDEELINLPSVKWTPMTSE